MTMSAALLLIALVGCAVAHDSVLFSTSTAITKSTPSVEDLIAVATPAAPVVFLVNPAFTLAQFSKAAAVYSTHDSTSPIVNAAKSGSAVSRHLEKEIHVPSAVYVTPDAAYTEGSSVYVVEAPSFSGLDDLASPILASLAEKATAFIVTNSEAVNKDPKRVKRVSIIGQGRETGKKTKTPSVAGESLSLPMVQPPLGNGATQQPCLFYLEGLNIVGKDKNGKFFTYLLRSEDEGASWSYDESSLVCPEIKDPKKERINEFVVTVTPGKPDMPTGATVDSPISIRLTITSFPTGFWELTRAELLEPITITKGDQVASATPSAGAINFKQVGMNSAFGNGWNCWDTQGIFFNSKDGKSAVGISFHGIQLHVYGQDNAKLMEGMSGFRASRTESCTGTFSAASWMGIISSLVMLAIFIFGFLMLNSIQTMDRFDDPKARQIVINVRE